MKCGLPARSGRIVLSDGRKINHFFRKKSIDFLSKIGQHAFQDAKMKDISPERFSDFIGLDGMWNGLEWSDICFRLGMLVGFFCRHGGYRPGTLIRMAWSARFFREQGQEHSFEDFIRAVQRIGVRRKAPSGGVLPTCEGVYDQFEAFRVAGRSKPVFPSENRLPLRPRPVQPVERREPLPEVTADGKQDDALDAIRRLRGDTWEVNQKPFV